MLGSLVRTFVRASIAAEIVHPQKNYLRDRASLRAQCTKFMFISFGDSVCFFLFCCCVVFVWFHLASVTSWWVYLWKSWQSQTHRIVVCRVGVAENRFSVGSFPCGVPFARSYLSHPVPTSYCLIHVSTLPTNTIFHFHFCFLGEIYFFQTW